MQRLIFTFLPKDVLLMKKYFFTISLVTISENYKKNCPTTKWQPLSFLPHTYKDVLVLQEHNRTCMSRSASQKTKQNAILI